MILLRLDMPVVRDQAHARELSIAGRAAHEMGREAVGQTRRPMTEKEQRRLLAMYERGLKDLQTGADEVQLYHPGFCRNFAFTRATLPALEQQLRYLQVMLGIVPPAPPRRIWA